MVAITYRLAEHASLRASQVLYHRPDGCHLERILAEIGEPGIAPPILAAIWIDGTCLHLREENPRRVRAGHLGELRAFDEGVPDSLARLLAFVDRHMDAAAALINAIWLNENDTFVCELGAGLSECTPVVEHNEARPLGSTDDVASGP